MTSKQKAALAKGTRVLEERDAGKSSGGGRGKAKEGSAREERTESRAEAMREGDIPAVKTPRNHPHGARH